MIITRITAIATVLTLSGCIMPPGGVRTAPAKPLNEVAAHGVRVNQTGYLPERVKIAIWASASKTGASFQLLDNSGKTVFNGTSIPTGADIDSGETLHQLDFSAFQTEGDGFSLKVASDTSVPFSISKTLYSQLKIDSVRYFYLNRSGVPLEMPYTGARKWARPAGHVSDRKMPCAPKTRCKYSKNVWGGWYDAGDYGKYVVNGGVSVWLLLNIHEQATAVRKNTNPTLIDNMNIPESGNGVPDILDEARFEIDWILRMQVGPGHPEAGMVHHRARELNFTAMGRAPDKEAVEPRFLRDTDASATLNLAAIGAQAARIYESYDKKFAAKCLQRAEIAFEAARANPDLFGPDNGIKGQGQYQDYEIIDNFFWAAAELWTTTGETKYFDFLSRSPYYLNPSRDAGGTLSAFNWGKTDALGTVTLSMGLRDLPDNSLDAQRKSLVDLADALLGLTEKQGYVYPMRQGRYPWGSNSCVLNNGLILALAFDFTGDERYRSGAVSAMDYVLGRNPNDFSYVSGYGEISMGNPHHRFFAPSYNKKLPPPPPGSLSGGPNSDLQDDTVKRYRAGCPGAKCYIDNIESFSTNEVAINWNAALVWLSTWLDERGSVDTTPTVKREQLAPVADP